MAFIKFSKPSVSQSQFHQTSKVKYKTRNIQKVNSSNKIFILTDAVILHAMK